MGWKKIKWWRKLFQVPGGPYDGASRGIVGHKQGEDNACNFACTCRWLLGVVQRKITVNISSLGDYWSSRLISFLGGSSGFRKLLDLFVGMFSTVHWFLYYLQSCRALFCTSAFSIMNLAYITLHIQLLCSSSFSWNFSLRETRGTSGKNFHDSRGEEDHLLFLDAWMFFKTNVVLLVSTFYTVGIFLL